jgi:two-component system, OmpR family, sensor histidine kinase KdpD
VKRFPLAKAGRFVIAAVVVAAITALYYRLAHVNPTTVSLTFLLAVLVVAAVWGLVYATFMAVCATLAFNFFFLPPVGLFTIADPQNWVALAAFLVTAVIASNLSDRARKEALNANRRRRDVERLYAFSQHLLSIDNVLELLNELPRQVVADFDVTSAAVFLSARGKSYYSDLATQALIGDADLRATATRGEPSTDESSGRYFIPLRIGVRTVGAVGLAGGFLSRETREAIGSLIAIAVERARAIEQLSNAEAARQSEKLRTVLLDSVTHEFRTPLTSILASAKALIWDDELSDSSRKELLAVINEEGERLNRLVGEAAEMAQLDAHLVELHVQPEDMHEAIDSVLEESRRTLKSRPIDVDVPDNLPSVPMDLKRFQEVLGHLLDNAAKYSAEGTPIHVTAELRDGSVVTSVADHGPGIDEFEQALIFDQFYRGRGQRSVYGTGMGLAIVKAIIEAHHGKVGVTSQLGHGSVFYFTLPIPS